MSGCELPVVINSGSGNQGITVSVPVIEYAKALAVPKERLYRALAVSNLIAIHEKSGIGRLSAYCGAVSAGCAAGCGIAYLQGADYEAIAHTLVNSLAIVSGIICGHHLRRRQAQLRRQDRFQRRSRHHGLPYVPERPAVPRRGRHRHQGR